MPKVVQPNSVAGSIVVQQDTEQTTKVRTEFLDSTPRVVNRLEYVVESTPAITVNTGEQNYGWQTVTSTMRDKGKRPALALG